MYMGQTSLVHCSHQGLAIHPSFQPKHAQVIHGWNFGFELTGSACASVTVQSVSRATGAGERARRVGAQLSTVVSPE